MLEIKRQQESVAANGLEQAVHLNRQELVKRHPLPGKHQSKRNPQVPHVDKPLAVESHFNGQGLQCDSEDALLLGKLSASLPPRASRSYAQHRLILASRGTEHMRLLLSNRVDFGERTIR